MRDLIMGLIRLFMFLFTGRFLNLQRHNCPGWFLTLMELCLQAGNYIHYMARFIAGFAVGFSSVWQLTLVTLAVVPLIALAGGSYAVVMIGLTARSQKAYSKAGEIAEEVIHVHDCPST